MLYYKKIFYRVERVNYVTVDRFCTAKLAGSNGYFDSNLVSEKLKLI